MSERQFIVLRPSQILVRQELKHSKCFMRFVNMTHHFANTWSLVHDKFDSALLYICNYLLELLMFNVIICPLIERHATRLPNKSSDSACIFVLFLNAGLRMLPCLQDKKKFWPKLNSEFHSQFLFLCFSYFISQSYIFFISDMIHQMIVFISLH